MRGGRIAARPAGPAATPGLDPCLRLCGLAITPRTAYQPWGTFAVNIAGGLLMGLLIGWLVATDRGDHHMLRTFGAVGFLGGFTTFSAYSLDIALMIERKAWLNAFAYAAGSVILALAALMIGMMIMRKVYP